jgi:hypothetical protein
MHSRGAHPPPRPLPIQYILLIIIIVIIILIIIYNNNLFINNIHINIYCMQPFEGCEYTSARIHTQNKLEFTYGRVEVRRYSLSLFVYSYFCNAFPPRES